MATWFSLPDDWPNDAQEVWTRRTYWFSTAFLSTFDLATFTFTTSGGAIIPWYEVARWRPQ